VAIKRVNGGAFSTWANTELKVGDRIEAMPPMGNFYAEADDTPSPHFIGFAAGSGITPVLSILRTELAANPQAQFTLVYANRNNNTIMFRNEISDLKDQYMGRFSVIHVLTDEAQDIDLFQGRINEAKCAELFRQWIDIDTVNMAFICGPRGMTEVVAKSLEDHGLDKGKIRFELFASAQPGRAKLQPVSDAEQKADISARVTIDGETRSFSMDRSTSLLNGALCNNIDAPFACCAGVCSTCKAKVISGEVEMRSNHALEDYEVEQGFVLTCQSYVKSDSVVVDYDQSGH